MSRQAIKIMLDSSEQSQLEQLRDRPTSPQRLAYRARIILWAAEGKENQRIAQLLKTRPARVCKWRRRFARQRLAGLEDAQRTGQPLRYDGDSRQRILKMLDQTPPQGYSQWNGSLLAQRLNLPAHHVWAVLRNYGISLQRRRSWCVSADAEFAQKAADVVGLYLNPPENAMVLAIDEKPAIQALERAQGWLRMPNGKALSGFNHEYTLHGASTLFAALDVATGQIQTAHYTRRRRREFLDFMNGVVQSYPKKEIHVVLDNLRTHKPKQDRWLKSHPHVHFHFTPTHASWLNQVEIWFSILTHHTLRGASFIHVRQLRNAIDAFVKVYNQSATPFEWTKKEVKQAPLQDKYANLFN